MKLAIDSRLMMRQFIELLEGYGGDHLKRQILNSSWDGDLLLG